MKVSARLRDVLGPALTLLLGILMIVLSGSGVKLEHNDDIMLIIVAFSGFYSGVGSSIAATVIVFGLYLVAVLAPGTFPSIMSADDAIGTLFTLPALVVMIGLLRRRLERVRVREGNYQTIVDNVGPVFFLADARANKYFFVSSNYEKVWGRPVASLYKDPGSWLGAVHPEDREWLKKDLGKGYEGVFTEVLGQKPFRVLRPDGSISWVSSLVVSIKGPSGKAERVAGILQDRTKEVEALLAIESQAKRFRDLVEYSNDAFALSSVDGVVSYVSPAIQRILGYTPEELIAAGALLQIHPDDVAAVRAAAETLKKANGEAVAVRSRVRHKDGSWRWIESVSSMRTGVDGVISNIRDIGQQVRGEEKIIEMNNRFTAILENAPVAVFSTDKDGLLTMRKGHASARAGVRPDEGLGTSYFEEFKDVPEHLTNVRRALRGETLVERLQVRKGFFEIAYAPILNADGGIEGMAGIATDITERAQAEGEVKQLSELQSKFITVISHQLRTPLSVVRWNLETLMDEKLGKLKKEQKDFLHVTYAANGEVVTLIDDFLLAMDIEENRASMTKETISLETLWGTVMAAQKRKCGAKELTCLYKAPKKALPTIQADGDKIRIAMEKILDNAVLYTPNGSVSVALSATADHVRFEVTDTGIGIPKEEQPRLFHRFFRASNALLIKTDASGLGLYVAKHIIESHGGTFGFKSVRDKGSTFWFELPVK